MYMCIYVYMSASRAACVTRVGRPRKPRYGQGRKRNHQEQHAYSKCRSNTSDLAKLEAVSTYAQTLSERPGP